MRNGSGPKGSVKIHPKTKRMEIVKTVVIQGTRTMETPQMTTVLKCAFLRISSV